MSDASDDRWGYRPHLDGLRAVAVYLVVAFHAGSSRLAGGFIGVDVFFVLSGYLVTTLLLRELDGPGDGKVDLPRFYARRIRRLLPAALVTLVVTVLAFRQVGNPLHFAAAVDAIRAAALYVSNWYFISQSTDYFAADLESSPVLHFWSLSVEEQFYFVWPLLLLGLHRLSRRFGARQRAALRVAIGALALASATAALTISASHPERAYFGTDTRAYQLLGGALLAASPAVAVAAGRRLRRPVLRSVVGLSLLGALCALATPWVHVGPVQRGVLTAVLTLALLVGLEAGEDGLGRRVLSLAPVVYLGRISYGTYLWHWLVVIVLGLRFDLTPTQTLAVTAGIATGLASLSYQVLEAPVRTSRRLDRARPAVIATGLALSVLVAVVVAPRVVDGPGGGLVAGDTAAGGGGTTGDAGARGVVAPSTVTVDTAVSPEHVRATFGNVFDYDACPPSAPTLCTLVEGPDDGPVAVVVGDSHAALWSTMLADLARDEGMTLLGGFLSYCPWPRGIAGPGVGRACLDDQDHLYDQLLPETDPDIVFLAHRPLDDVNDQLPVLVPSGDILDGVERDAALAAAARTTVESLVADGRTVVLFEPTPVAPPIWGPLECLTVASSTASCRFVTSREPTPEDLVFRALDAEHDEVVSIDADLLTCPYRPVCDPVLDGLIVHRDANHLTIEFARSLVDEIATMLREQGVLDA